LGKRAGKEVAAIEFHLIKHQDLPKCFKLFVLRLFQSNKKCGLADKFGGGRSKLSRAKGKNLYYLIECIIHL
jgi:hypothetical protein